MHDETAHKRLEEQLVAYLDGELSVEESRQVESLLATDADARRRLQAMERTWDLLDDLDALPAGDQFARSTLEMVAVSACQDAEQNQAAAPRRRLRRWLATGVALLAAAGLGFFVVVWLRPDPNRNLLRELPILENLDPYRQVQSLDFLQKLDQAKLFASTSAKKDLAASSPEPLESTPERRRRVEQMTPSQKEQLLRQQKRFESLEPDEQRQLRRLDDALRAAPDVAALRQVMQRYYRWLKTLTPYVRAELAEMPVDQRLSAVKKRLHESQSRSADERWLEGKDADALWTWLEDCAARHASELRTLLPEARRKEITTWTPAAQQRFLTFELSRRILTSGSGQPPMLTDDDLTRLRAMLTSETQKRLAAMPVARQWPMVTAWVRHQLRQRIARGGTLSAADHQRIAQFFENELTDQQRDRLLAMPNEEMQRELQRMYFLGVKSPEGMNHRPNGPHRNKRPANVQQK